MPDDFPRFIPVALDLSDGPVPLSRWEDGSIRVTNSRVPLELVIHKFQSGETSEEVAEEFETVELEYACTIESFYRRHQTEVDAYVAEMDRQRDAMREYRVSKPSYNALMARLQAKIDERAKSGHASSAR